MKKNIFSFLLFSIISNAQQLEKVDFQTADSYIHFDLSQQKVIGKINYTFEVKSPIDTIKIDAKNMLFKAVLINDKKVEYSSDKNFLKLYNGYRLGKNTVNIEYEAHPKQAMYFTNNGSDLQIYTQGQGKHNSHWLPSFDNPNEKIIFNQNITFDNDYTVISNGILAKKTTNENNTTWSYKMDKPMSSYLAMIAIGKYLKTIDKSSSEIPIENYIFIDDKQKYKSTYIQSKVLFDFLENTISVPYPWKIYRNIPIEDFIYSGMENTTSTIFNNDFVVDDIGKNDRSYFYVEAHELAHHWFGNLITAKSDEDHWLHEGFATYFAILAEGKLMDKNLFYWKLYTMAENIQRESKYKQNTIIWSKGATTTTYYEKGAWALFALEQQIGTANFQKAIKNFLNKYAYKSVSTNDFLDEVEKTTPFERQQFEENWLKNPKFPIKTALQLIEKNPLIEEYLKLIDLQKTPFIEKKSKLLSTLKNSKYDQVKKEVIYQLFEQPYEEVKEFYTEIAQSKDLKSRQALMQIIDEIPSDFMVFYKKFLHDDSYITKEIVLKNLWHKDTEGKNNLLEQTKNWIGFNDKNLRITWLMLALATPEYKPEEKANLYLELQNYSTSKYNSNIRTNAIRGLWFINPYDSNVLPQLANGLIHPQNSFRFFCKDAIEQLIKKKEFRNYFENLIPNLSETEKLALKNILY